MSILSNIRKRSGLLIGIIALALLAFVLSDLFSRGGSNQNLIGEVNGEKIFYLDFSSRMEQMKEVLTNRNLSNLELAKKTWKDLSEEILIRSEIEKTGFFLSEELISKYFFEQMSNLGSSRNQIIGYLEYLKEYQPKQWSSMKQKMTPNILKNQYYKLVNSGLMTNSYLEETKIPKVDFELFSAPYKTQSIPSSESIMTYLTHIKHPAVMDRSADIRYILFEEKASEKDRKATKNELEDLAFRIQSRNSDIEDIIDTYSDVTYNGDAYVYEKELPKKTRKQIENLSVGKFTKIYEDEDAYKLTKLLKKEFLPDSVESSHIFISYSERKVEDAKKLADSLFIEVQKKGTIFSSVCKKFSEDLYTKNNGGNFGYQTYSNVLKAFRKFLFESERNIELIESSEGLHIVKVHNRKGKSVAYKLATLVRYILPSEETLEQVYTRLVQFEETTTSETFSDNAKIKNLKVYTVNNLAPMSEIILGLGANRQIVKWIFSDKNPSEGDIERFEIPSGYVLVQVLSKRETKTVNLDLVPKHLLASFSKKDAYQNTLKDVQLVKSLQQLDTTNLRSFDPKMAGILVSLPAEKLSHPVAGRDNIFRVKILNKTAQLNKVTYPKRSISNLVYETIRKKSDEIRYLYNFF